MARRERVERTSEQKLEIFLEGLKSGRGLSSASPELLGNRPRLCGIFDPILHLATSFSPFSFPCPPSFPRVGPSDSASPLRQSTSSLQAFSRRPCCAVGCCARTSPCPRAISRDREGPLP